MAIHVGDQSAIGTLVVPTRKTYKIRGRLYEKAELVKITTCHRETVIEKPRDKFEIVYHPTEGIEDTGYCPMEIGAFDERGQHSWAFIDFHRDESLIGQIGCNGDKHKSLGVSVCQSRTGLIQTIEFLEPVEVQHPNRCPEPHSEDRLLWQYTIASEKCVYVFETDSGQIHRLLTLGYDNVMLRR